MKEYIEAAKAGALLTSGITVPLFMSGIGISWQFDVSISAFLFCCNYILLFGSNNKE